MVQKYETVVVYDGTLPDDALRREQAKVEDFLKKNSEFERTDVWGKRELAFEIRRKRLGYYCLFLYKGDGDIAGKLQSDFHLNTSVLRYLSVIREDHPLPPAVGGAVDNKAAGPADAAQEEVADGNG